METTPNTERRVRFVPYYAEFARKYQRFFVSMEVCRDGRWVFGGDIKAEDKPLMDRILADFPVEGALICGLVAAESGPTSAKAIQHSHNLAIGAAVDAVSLVQKWRRADYLLRMQGIAPHEEWERQRGLSMARGMVAESLSLVRETLRPIPPAPSIRHVPSRGIIYLVHGEPMEPLIGYVGQTVDEEGRSNSHLSGADPCTSFLIANLKALGLTPKFTVLQSCPKSKLNRQEREWYSRLSSGGWKLYNRMELAHD